MSEKLNFLWIDDNPNRELDSHNLSDQLNVNIKFKNVKHKDLIGELNKLLSEDEPPDLVLMDHMLNNVKIGNFKTGSTAAEYIRENDRWRDCPIVCTTAVRLNNEVFDFHRKSIYADVIEISKISNYYSTFLSIAESFKILRVRAPQNVNDLVNLLKAPVDEEKRLKDILPEDLKTEDGYKDRSLLYRISNWVRHNLIAKPGFLYDQLWTATLIGIKVESFKKVEEHFIEAKYDGIFADKGKKRWWQTKLREILFSKFPDSDTIFPCILGRKLPGIIEEDFSKCYASGEDYPETVAFIDETSLKKAPMRIRHTIPHPNFGKSLHFEEIRMMKAVE